MGGGGRIRRENHPLRLKPEDGVRVTSRRVTRRISLRHPCQAEPMHPHPPLPSISMRRMTHSNLGHGNTTTSIINRKWRLKFHRLLSCCRPLFPIGLASFLHIRWCIFLLSGFHRWSIHRTCTEHLSLLTVTKAALSNRNHIQKELIWSLFFDFLLYSPRPAPYLSLSLSSSSFMFHFYITFSSLFLFFWIFLVGFSVHSFHCGNVSFHRED